MSDHRTVYDLVGRDRLSDVFDRVAERARRMAGRIDTAADDSNNAVERFTRDAGGRLRDARGRFAAAGDAAAQMGDDVEAGSRRAGGGLRSMAQSALRMLPSLRSVSQETAHASEATEEFTRDAGGRLRDARGRFIAVGDAGRRMGDDVDSGGRRGSRALSLIARGLSGAGSAATSVLPSLGAVGPTLIGIGVAAAITAAPALGAFVPMLVGLGTAAATAKLAFGGVGEAVALAGTNSKEYRKTLKAMSPEQRDFTKAVVSAKKEFSGLGGEVKKIVLPAFTRALQAASPVIRIVEGGVKGMARVFAGLGDQFGKLFGNGRFQSALRTNMTLGTGFIQQLITPLGSLITSLLEFGAASKPTLDAFGHGISVLLGSGLPGFFTGLQSGVQGSAEMFTGLFNAVNKVLPALGQFVGAAASSLGPALREIFESAGDQAAGGFRALGRAVVYLKPVFGEVGAAMRLMSMGLQVVGTIARQTGTAVVESLWPSFRQSKDAVGPLQRLATWMKTNQVAVQEFTRAASSGILGFVQTAVSSTPMVVKGFRLMLTGVLTVFDGIVSGAAKAFGWMPGLGPKLKAANREFDGFKNGVITGLHEAEDASQRFADTVGPRLARNKLQMNIDSWNRQIATATAKLRTVPPSKKAALLADIADLQRKVAAARAEMATLKDKTVSVLVKTHTTGGTVFHEGGQYRARGGLISGPGTGTSDDVPIWASDGEFMVNARATARNRALLEAINTGADGYAAGGQIRKRKTPTRPSASGLWNIDHVTGGSMVAGLTGTASQIAGAVARITNAIQRAFKGVNSTVDDRLVAMLARGNTRLQALAAQRDQIAAKIAEARTFASDTAATARGTAALSSLGEGAAAKGGRGILAGMQAKLARIRNFTSYITTLAKRGLSRDVLRQLIEMGPEAGFSYASVLAGSSTKMLAAINRTQGAINESSRGLGMKGADALYDSGKNSGKGFLKGLESQQKAIEALMVRIAKGMQVALRKALGIKSPSTVLARDGGHATEGIAVGALRRLPVLQRAMARVADTVASTPLAFPAVALPAGRGGYTGPTVIKATFNVSSLDPLAAAREIRRVLLELKRNYGLNVDLNLGGL